MISLKSIKFDGTAQQLSLEIEKAIYAVVDTADSLRMSREFAVFMTKLEEASMWANKAVKSDQLLRESEKTV